MADKPRDFKVSKASYKITVDADKIRFPLVVRLVQQGDVMIPFGMKGHKLLSDLMTDCKMTLLVVTIVWLLMILPNGYSPLRLIWKHNLP